MRWNYLASLSLWGMFIWGCSNAVGQTDQRQGVSTNKTAQNINWRQFVSDSPQLALSVVGASRREAEQPPIISAQCIPSGDRYVSQVTITWNDPAGGEVSAKNQPEAVVRRFDVAVHYNAFVRNFYTSALSTEKLKRFTIPSNSNLLSNPDAMQSTGSSLFPVLMDYKLQLLEDSRSRRQFYKQAVVLRELNSGIATTLRVSRLAGRQWNAEHQFQVTAPVCPVSF